ncbi:AraC family transcriptional regulator [Martelella endophytica]|uniref:AraC family transcriptional regulator n=1 Tax=Martelella endophytica TaxID=1486262 RepID=UPI0005F13963|nr:helix-turn-helix transcriptional regulator [Martelella endophytica]
MSNDIVFLSQVPDDEGPGSVLDPTRPLTVRAQSWRAGDKARPAHSHPRGQLLWPVSGILLVRSGESRWLVPPSHAVWIPGDIVHEVLIETDVTASFIYVDPSVPQVRGAGCEVLHMTPLMRQLILRFRALADDGIADDRLQRLAFVIIDELSTLPTAPLSLPAGEDARLKRVTALLLARPEDRSGLEALARFAGAGPRTLERLFLRETGLSFSEWRNRLRLMEAVNHLSRGKSSAEIAGLLGYSSPSAFVAAFRRSLGMPPQSYLRDGVSAVDRPNDD